MTSAGDLPSTKHFDFEPEPCFVVSWTPVALYDSDIWHLLRDMASNAGSPAWMLPSF